MIEGAAIANPPAAAVVAMKSRRLTDGVAGEGVSGFFWLMIDTF
jgi:hypothetical protein